MPPTDFASAPTDPAFPGAVRPHRRRTIDAHGVAVSMVEWGDESSPPVVFAHGGFDFAETFNVFAPLLDYFVIRANIRRRAVRYATR